MNDAREHLPATDVGEKWPETQISHSADFAAIGPAYARPKRRGRGP